MGYLTAAGSSARVAGPIVVSYVYKFFGTYPTIGLMVGSLFISLVLTILTYKRLAPESLDDVGPVVHSTTRIDSTKF